MAIRLIYQDSKGPYFKGEGLIFYLPQRMKAATHVKVVMVCCGSTMARASYVWNDRLRFVNSEVLGTLPQGATQ